MAEETILTWNATNWVTVILMTVLGLAIIGAAIKLAKSRKGA